MATSLKELVDWTKGVEEIPTLKHMEMVIRNFTGSKTKLLSSVFGDTKFALEFGRLKPAYDQADNNWDDSLSNLYMEVVGHLRYMIEKHYGLTNSLFEMLNATNEIKILPQYTGVVFLKAPHFSTVGLKELNGTLNENGIKLGWKYSYNGLAKIYIKSLTKGYFEYYYI